MFPFNILWRLSSLFLAEITSMKKDLRKALGNGAEGHPHQGGGSAVLPD
jgi:hypothetical protein